MDLASLLTLDGESGTFRRDLLAAQALDFSVDSLGHIDTYLEALHETQPQGGDLACVVLRTGAYVGEVIRRAIPDAYHWVTHDEAARHSDFITELEKGLGTVGVLWGANGSILFPLAKVGKFLQNGNEESVYFYARVLLAESKKNPS